MKTKLMNLFALVAVSSLAACGGGGGSSAPPVATAPAPAPTPGPAPAPAPAPVGAINTTPPTPTYLMGSAQYVAFTQLNNERASCGFGYMKQSAVLDQAAQDAGVYFLNRVAESFNAASLFIHLEDSAKSGYTGQLPQDRAAYRRYQGDFNQSDYIVNESLATSSLKGSNPQADAVMANFLTSYLLSTVYHTATMMSPRTEVGVAFNRGASSDGYDMGRVNFVVGKPAADIGQNSTAVRTYPCAGTTRVTAAFTPNTESPNPAPDLGANVVGTPIYVNGPEGQTITVASATVVPTAGGTAVANRVISYSTEAGFQKTGLHGTGLNEAWILPLTALVKATAYTVTISGTTNGTNFTTSISFTPSL